MAVVAVMGNRSVFPFDPAVGRALIAHLVTSTKSAPLDDLKAVYAERDIVVTRLSDSICSV